MSDASNTTTMPFPVVKLLEASKADTEEITQVTDTPTTVPATTEEMPAVTTTLTMPVVAQQKRRRIIDWLNSWGPTKVLVLPTAAVVGLYIGALIATPKVVPDAMTPDVFAKKPSVTQSVEPTKPSKTPVPALPTDRHTDSWPVRPKTTPTPSVSTNSTPSSSTSASTSPSSAPSTPSFETPGKGGGLSPQPSASATNIPSALPSDTPITSEPPEETFPAPSDPAPSESTSPAAETGATP